MRVVVSPAAEADLADIFDYSHATFGEEFSRTQTKPSHSAIICLFALEVLRLFPWISY